MKRILLILTAVLFCFVLIAVPAAPFLTTFTQQDGSTLQIYVRGDERLNWAETSDGYTLLNSDRNKVYAIKDVNGDLVPSEVLAQDPENRTQEELAFLTSIPKYLKYSKTQVNLANQLRGERLGTFPTTGVNNMVVILANFNDTSTSYSQTNFDNMMNQDNYNGTGSFKQYYLEVSYGQLTVNATVVGWVTVPNSHDYYGPESRWAEFARDAVVAADPLVDYSLFDNDGDGIVDGVAIYHQGRGQEATGDVTDIWSHSFNLQSGGFNVTLDGVRIREYTVQAERQYWSMAGIGVICHEFGHNLGAPDFYDTDYGTGGQHDGTGEWDIMGSGAYNGNGNRPAHHNMWTKKFYGWVEPEEIYYDGSFTLQSSTTNPEAYFFTTAKTNEYMLMENIQKTGFNSNVPGSGMLVYHVDESWILSHLNQNNVNASAHQGIYVVAAQGGTNSSTAPFPTYYNDSLTDTSNPPIPSWFDHEINKGVTDITKAGNIINFNFFDNSAYKPIITFAEFKDNNYYLVGDDINLDLTIYSSLVDIDMVEVLVNNVTQHVHLQEPYNLTIEAVADHLEFLDSGFNIITIRAYSGNSNAGIFNYSFNVTEEELPFLDQFEEYTDFALEFGEWVVIDNDQQETIELSLYDYPHSTEPKSFMIFNPDATVPHIREITAYSGDKAVVAFSNATDIPNDDWLISPLIELGLASDEQANFRFSALGTASSNEMFNVYYSTGSTDPEDFILLQDNPIQAAQNWQRAYEFALPHDLESVRVALQVVSTGGKYVMFDDLRLNVVTVVSNDDQEVESVVQNSITNYPNPFNPETTISYNLKEAGQVVLDVYNIRGQRVASLVNEQQTAGNHTIVWNGKDINNQSVASGVYLYKIRSGKFSATKKMILMK